MHRPDASTRGSRPARYSPREIIGKPALATWCLYLILTPFYVFDSGLPQPGDALVILLLPLALLGWDGRLPGQFVRTLRPLFWFTGWVFVVNIAWSVIQGMWSRPEHFLIHPLFYAYNAAVLTSALIIAKPDPARFLRLTVDVTFLMIVFQVVASFFYRTDLYRGTLFFNSPNQLGYYALLSACLLAMAPRTLGLGRLMPGLGVTGCAYLAILSSSRSSLAGILVLLVVLLFSNPRAILFGAIVAVGLTTLGGPLTNALEFSQRRASVSTLNPDSSFAEERGYDRIVDYPEYLLLGAGEGDYERFAKPGEPARELHSSFGTLLFSYGVVGISLFMVFGLRMVRGASMRSILMLVPAMVYTVAHQGLRFTTFWVVVAAFMLIKQLDTEVRGWPRLR